MCIAATFFEFDNITKTKLLSKWRRRVLCFSACFARKLRCGKSGALFGISKFVFQVKR